MARDKREIHKGIRFGTGQAENDYFDDESDPDELVERIKEETEAEGYDGPDTDEILANLTINGAISGFVDDENLDLDSPDPDLRANAQHRVAMMEDAEARRKARRTRRGSNKKRTAKKAAEPKDDSSGAAE